MKGVYTENMVTGIIGAMEHEVKNLKAEMTDTVTTEIAAMTFVKGLLGTHQVVVVQCGIGKVNAGICAQILISQFHVSRIINTGVAGALDSRLNIGDIVVSEDAVQHDYDVSPIGFAKGEIPYTGLYAFPADPELTELAMKAAANSGENIQVMKGRVCSGDQFIASGEQKHTIVSTFGGLCCEMEGAAIAQVCFLNKVPFVIVRAISDKADIHEELDFEEFQYMAAERCGKIVRDLIKTE